MRRKSDIWICAWALGIMAVSPGVGAQSEGTNLSTVATALEESQPQFPKFPDHYTPLNLKKWEAYRGEGQTLKNQLLHGIPYYLKQRRIMQRAPIEEVEYFNTQNLILSEFQNKLQHPRDGAIKVGFGGDLMWIRNQWDTFLDPALREQIHQYDVFLANLESPVSSSHKVKSFWPDYATYNSAPGLITSFSKGDKSPFTAVGVANNHTLDKDESGAMDTLAFLDSLKIQHSGARVNERDPAWIKFERNGIKFGFYAATWGLNQGEREQTTPLKIEFLQGIAPETNEPVQIDRVAEILKEMEAAKIDFKIVMLHWGHEYEFYPSPKIVKMGHAIAQAGADLIIGSHPHVLQPAELCFFNGYEQGLPPEVRALVQKQGCALNAQGPARKSMIVYSMGDFTTALTSFYCALGILREVQVYRDGATHRADFDVGPSHLIFNEAPKLFSKKPRRLLFWNDVSNPSDDQLEKLDKIKALLGL